MYIRLNGKGTVLSNKRSMYVISVSISLVLFSMCLEASEADPPNDMPSTFNYTVFFCQKIGTSYKIFFSLETQVS